MHNGTFFTPPFQIDLANCVKLGKNVFVNHGLTMMSLGEIIIEDDVMMGPEVGLLTVNHEAENIRVIMTKRIHLGNILGGAKVSVTLLQVTAAMVSGLFLGAIYLRTGSIVLPIAIHFFSRFALLYAVQSDYRNSAG